MPIWHQQQKRTPCMLSRPSSTKTIDDTPFCSFCVAASHRTTQCRAIPLYIRGKLINTRIANLTLPTRPRRTPPNGDQGSSPRRCNCSTLNTLESTTAANKQPTAQQRTQPVKITVANLPTTSPAETNGKRMTSKQYPLHRYTVYLKRSHQKRHNATRQLKPLHMRERHPSTEQN